jgi:hypothetical protein
MFSFEGFFCNLDVLFLAVNFFQFLVIKTLDPGWIQIGIQPKMLDPDQYQMNTYGSETLVRTKERFIAGSAVDPDLKPSAGLLPSCTVLLNSSSVILKYRWPNSGVKSDNFVFVFISLVQCKVCLTPPELSVLIFYVLSVYVTAVFEQTAYDGQGFKNC